MSSISSFADLALAPSLLKAVAAIGYEQPSPIQAQSIPHLLNGEDLLGTAQTGTGKTAAFALPVLSNIDAKSSHTQCLVLAPTRELAIQVAEAFQSYAAHMKGFHVLPIYGGSDYGTQLRGLKRGAQVVVGTPGRVMDHLRKGSLKLDKLKTIVLDEADEMLRMGFIDDVTWILDQAPEERQVALFSATMPKEIRRVADTYLRDPQVVKIEAKTATVERIEQSYWLVQGTNKMDALTRILEVESFDGMIIFARTKTATAEVAEKLEARGFASAALNGDMSQQIRERVIERLKNGKLDIVVATDVAARGIDVARVSHVLNYDIPYDTESYVHRIGRTGRAGRSGKAILFVNNRERRMLNTIERVTNQKIARMDLPSRQEVTSQRISNFKQAILDAHNSEEDLTPFRELVLALEEEQPLSGEDIAATLAFLLQKDKPLFLPPEPERKERHERDGERGERRERRSEPEAGMKRYRVEVGRNHKVKPGDLVGAIANEASIDSKYIGQITLFDKFSTVDLPEGMPRETLDILKDAWVRGQKLAIRPDSGPGPRKGGPGPGKGKPKGGKKFSGKKGGGDFKKPRKRTLKD